MLNKSSHLILIIFAENSFQQIDYFIENLLLKLPGYERFIKLAIGYALLIIIVIIWNEMLFFKNKMSMDIKF